MPPSSLDTLLDFSDPAGSEQRLLAAARAASGAARAEALALAARAQGLQRRFDDAMRTLDQAAALAPPASRPAVRVALERGRVLNSSGRASEALPHFHDAMQLASSLAEDHLAVDAAHMLAIAAPTPAEQVAFGERAIAMADASTDPRARRWLGPLLNNMGWSHHDAGDFAKALELFERAVAFREQAAEPAPLRIAHYARARALRSLGRVEEALAAQLRIVAEADDAGSPDGYFHEEAAECLLELGRADEARPHFARAHALLSADAWMREHEAPRLARLAELGAAPTA